MLTDKEKQEIRDDYAKKVEKAILEYPYSDTEELNEEHDNIIKFSADYVISIIEYKIKEKLEEVEKEIKYLEKTHQIELDSISLKSLKEFISWSYNRKVNKKILLDNFIETEKDYRMFLLIKELLDNKE